MSGDSLDPSDYDEVRAMREYAIDCGVPEGAIISDELGLNTHASVYRAMHIFGKSIIIITQNYHLERAVFLAKCFGADAIGVYCDKERLGGQSARDAREVLARVKDFFVVILSWFPGIYMLEIGSEPQASAGLRFPHTFYSTDGILPREIDSVAGISASTTRLSLF